MKNVLDRPVPPPTAESSRPAGIITNKPGNLFNPPLPGQAGSPITPLSTDLLKGPQGSKK
jgi:hypothetical protein